MTIHDENRKLWLRIAARRAGLFLTALLGVVVGAGSAQPTPPSGTPVPIPAVPAAERGQRITPSFKDADITQIVEAVSAATGKNFIIDPRVRAQVTMLSSTPMSPAAFYEAFLAILQVHGFVAEQAGDVIKIVPDANARQSPSVDLPDHVSATSDEIVTQVIGVKNVSATQLVPILRPLIPQYGHLVAYQPANVLIISDRANNVSRIMRIIRRIDESGDSDVDIIPMQNASATEIVRVINSLVQGQQSAEGGVPFKVVADDRSNSILLSGEKSQRLRLKALIAHLDTPLENGGDTQVRYLHYASADKLATKLKEQAGATSSAAGAPAAPGGTASSSEKTTIWADVGTNALIITAPPKTMRALNEIIDKLDIRRLQVHLEALIVEVTTDKTADLGVNWLLLGSQSGTIPVAGFVEPVGGTSIANLAASVIGGTSSLTSSSIPSDTTLAVGRYGSTGVNFAAMVRAVQSVANTNIISTPSVVTMDNQEATIKIAQEVPFVTGQYTNGSTTTSGTVNPFQTIQRQEVGTILKITPQINEGNTLILKIDEESSSIAASSQGAVDLITNKRTVSTNVLIEDKGTLVLGGLMQDSATQSEQHVPLLGSIPLLGELFRNRSQEKTKTDLFFFIKPTILRDANDAVIETNQKYEYLRQEQRINGPGHELIPLLPGTKDPSLDPLTQPQTAPEPPPRASRGAAAAGKPNAKGLSVTVSTAPLPGMPDPPPSSTPPVAVKPENPP
jgi:general secretion pathway protein D